MLEKTQYSPTNYSHASFLRFGTRLYFHNRLCAIEPACYVTHVIEIVALNRDLVDFVIF